MPTVDCTALQIAIVPGPPDPPAEEFFSFDVEDFVKIDPRDAGGALLAFPGVTGPSASAAASWDWRATLRTEWAAVVFEMTMIESDEPTLVWGGFGLHGTAERMVIVNVAKLLSQRLGSAWILDGDCRMRTAELFARDGMASRDTTA